MDLSYILKSCFYASHTSALGDYRAGDLSTADFFTSSKCKLYGHGFQCASIGVCEVMYTSVPRACVCFGVTTSSQYCS